MVGMSSLGGAPVQDADDDARPNTCSSLAALLREVFRARTKAWRLEDATTPWAYAPELWVEASLHAAQAQMTVLPERERLFFKTGRESIEKQYDPAEAAAAPLPPATAARASWPEPGRGRGTR
jgi:hypothetical protein